MSDPRPLAGLRILVAEDDPANLDVIVGMARLVGAEVTSARDGREALDAIAAQGPDIVLLDIEMPVMSGLDVLREVRGTPDRPTMICVTAHTGSEHVGMARRLGADGTIAKPLRSAERLAALILDLHRPPATGEAVLDPAVFEPLARAMGDAMIGQLIAQLGKDLSKCARALSAAAESGAIGEIRSQTHILTGVAGSVGAVRLADLSGRLNAAAHADDLATLRLLLPDLSVEIERLMSALAPKKAG